MAWYRIGTLAVTNGSPVVTGSGTAFIANVQIGHAINLPDGKAYEVAAINSDTQITLGSSYLGASATGQAYSVQPNQGFAQQAASSLATFLSQVQGWIAGALAGRFGDGTTAAPGVTFAADQDTGVFRPGNDQLALVAGGAQVLLATPTDLTTPDNLTVNGGANTRGISIVTSNAILSLAANGATAAAGSTISYSWSNGGQGPLILAAAAGEVARFTPAGALSLGATAVPTGARLYSAGGGNGIALGQNGTSSTLNGISMNGSLSDGGCLGLFGGGSDTNLYLQTQNVMIFRRAGAVESGRIDVNGLLQIGATTAANHAIRRAVGTGTVVLGIGPAAGDSHRFYPADAAGASSATTCYSVDKVSATARSINAAGTINASGADYAEYLRKAPGCGMIAKGDICGVDANGELVTAWAQAVRYVVKSTDPNLVGGDSWSGHLGARPTTPAPIGPEPELGAAPVDASAEVIAAWQDAFADRHAAWLEDTARFNSQQAAFAAASAQFDADLEAARQTVDRIAFCGQIPVNVDGSTLATVQAALAAGSAVYLIAVAVGDSIGAQAVREADMTLPLYMRRLGAVWAVRDGRPVIDVQHG